MLRLNFAVLFDLDGLLVDTEAIQSEAYKVVMKRQYGKTPQTTEHGTVHIPGEKTSETWIRLLQTGSIEGDIDRLTEYKRAAALTLMANHVNPMPGAVELIDSLRKKGILMAVVTSAQRKRANLILEKLGIDDKVGAVITANDILEVKPAPDAYLAAAERLHMNPKDCIVFEDAEVGVLAAKRAGAKVIAVPNEFTKDLDFSLADLVVGSLADITVSKLDEISQR